MVRQESILSATDHNAKIDRRPRTGRNRLVVCGAVALLLALLWSWWPPQVAPPAGEPITANQSPSKAAERGDLGQQSPTPPVPLDNDSDTGHEAEAAIVVVVAAAETGGPIRCAIFDSEAAFASRASPVAAGVARLEGDRFVWQSDPLAAGRYAIAVYRDTNDNDRLDYHTFGYPVEPYAFSNGARGQLGPPTFDAAAIDHGSETSRAAIELK
jgi:uncharacterized protein (DUF2141 family)